jgi:26S proteasome regulatory subunit T5
MSKEGAGTGVVVPQQPESRILEETATMSVSDIQQRSRLIDQEIYVLRQNEKRLKDDVKRMKEETKANHDKIKLNRMMPYLVSTIVEIFDSKEATGYEAEEDGANVDLDAQRVGKSAVVKTSTRQTIFLPVIGLVDPDSLKPGDLVGVNRDSYLVLDTLPAEYDSRVKAMEVDEKPKDTYMEVGGLEKQIRELVEAVVLPITQKERYIAIGIQPPKGVLMYGSPGTGKTMLARACAAQCGCCFLKLAGPQLVQMYIGDGAKIVRDAFALAKQKAPAIIFIDELDAIGTRRSDSDKHGEREVQRTMLELLAQLDGFASTDDVKVIAATNRIDVLDPALLRSGRLDRKVEFPMPDEQARARILQIHSRRMTVDKDVNYEELARSTDDMNGAQLKAVCVEAGMLALRREGTIVSHEDFMEGIAAVLAKKKSNLNYYA